METIFEPLPPSAIQYQKDHANGKSMHNLSIKRESAIESARLSGIVPFSIINFNPVDAVPPPGLIDFTIPAFSSPLGIKKSVNYRGKTRTGSLVVVENLKGHAVITDARSDGDQASPDTSYDWRVIQPIEQAKVFDDSYNRTKEQRPMGGILVFKGNGSVLEDPKGIIEIPVATRLKNGSLQYSAKPITLAERLQEIFTIQKDYCMAQLNTCQQYWDDEEFKKSITFAHKAWSQFAIDQGLAEQGRMPWLMPDNPDSACVKCGKMRTSGKAMFCGCGRPYDPFAAFMAGEHVEDSYLAVLSGEQLKQVKAEMHRRKKLFSDEPESKKQN